MKYITVLVGAAIAQKFATDCGPGKSDCPEAGDVCISRTVDSIPNQGSASY